MWSAVCCAGATFSRSRTGLCHRSRSGDGNEDRIAFQILGEWAEDLSENMNESRDSENEPVRERLGRVRAGVPCAGNLSLLLLPVSSPNSGSRESMTGAIHFLYAIHVDIETRLNVVAAVQTIVKIEVYPFFKRLGA